MGNMKSIVVALLLSVVSVCVNAADSGFYIGGGLGQAGIRDDSEGGTTINFDADDTSYKAFLGYRMTWLPLIDLAAEAGYTDFGSPSENSVKYKLHGASASGLVILPLGPLDLFGKVGALYWSSDVDTGGGTSSKNGTNLLYGIGVAVKVWRLAVRAEYEYFDVKDIDVVQMYSVSAVFQF